MRKYTFVFFILYCLHIQVSLALSLKGRVCDFKTRNDVVGAIVTVMTIDSTVIAQTVASSHWINGEEEGYTSQFYLNVPYKQNTTYIIKAQMIGYKTTYMNFTIGKIGKTEYEKVIPDILLKQESKLLNEIVVSSTKIKFYYKGDTVVYNADAFVLAEGSMLDALIRQMPGVEMKENGDIYHNGKLVKNLLLNGKDFFKNKKIMLDNLPTYMVKNIKVYDKASDKAEFLGSTDPNLKSYVMDVCLKKEYSIGWISNIETGIGITDMDKRNELPYLGRLFAMRFTDHSNIALYCNINNLNDDRRPGRNDSWKPSDIKEGIKSEQLSGFNYNIDSRNKKWKLSGEFNFSHFNSNNSKRLNRTSYVITSNINERINNYLSNKDIHLETGHELMRTWKYVMLRIRPTLSYSKYDNSSCQESYAFTADSLINHYYNEGMVKGYNLNSGINLKSTLKFENTSDYIDCNINTGYGEKKNDTFNRYSLSYGDSSIPSAQAYQYYRNKPDKTNNVETEFRWNHILGKGFVLNMKYCTKIINEKRTSNLYLIDKIRNYSDVEFGLLPSVWEYEQCIDHRNSYYKDYSEFTQVLSPKIIWHHSDNIGNWYCQADIPIMISNQKLEYKRGTIDTTFSKRPITIGVTNGFCEWKSKDNQKQLFISYDMSWQTPDLINYVNMYDDTDPLNIKLGNDGIKKTCTHHLHGVYAKYSQIDHYYTIDYKYISNAISMGYLYDERSGTRTYKPYNVDGNADIEGRYTLSFNLDKKKFYNLRLTTRLQHIKNVDLIGSSTTTIVRNEVLTEKMAETITLSYQRRENSVSIKTSINYRNIHCAREQFDNMNIWDYNYGLNATFALPWKIQLSTDITMYSRRGYNDRSMNTNDLVWNARLSKSVMNGKIVFLFDGFDILGNLSDISWSVNGQGRTETHRNVMPQYGIFHMQYRLNKQPKK